MMIKMMKGVLVLEGVDKLTKELENEINEYAEDKNKK